MLAGKFQLLRSVGGQSWDPVNWSEAELVELGTPITRIALGDMHRVILYHSCKARIPVRCLPSRSGHTARILTALSRAQVGNIEFSRADASRAVVLQKRAASDTGQVCVIALSHVIQSSALAEIIPSYPASQFCVRCGGSRFSGGRQYHDQAEDVSIALCCYPIPLSAPLTAPPLTAPSLECGLVAMKLYKGTGDRQAIKEAGQALTGGRELVIRNEVVLATSELVSPPIVGVLPSCVTLVLCICVTCWTH